MIRIVKLIALLAFYQFAFPFALGATLQKSCKGKQSVKYKYVMGYLVQLGLFMVTATIHFGAGASLEALTDDWMKISILVFLISVVYLAKDLWLYCREINKHGNRCLRNLAGGVLFVAGLLAVVAALRAFTIPSAMDDTIEVVRTNVKYADEKLYLHNEFTGELRESPLYEFPESADHPLALYYAVFTYLADISANRMVLYVFSVLLLFLAAMSFSELGQRMFPGNPIYRRIFFAVVCLVYVRMLLSNSLIGMQLLSTTWSGAACFVGILVPFVLAYIADLQRRRWTIGDVFSILGLILCGNLLLSGGGITIAVLFVATVIVVLGRRGVKHA